MALTQGKLGLTVRVKNDAIISDIPIDAKSALRWVDDLPIADIGETASRVFHYLYDLNQSPIHPKIRLHILEALTATTNMLFETLSDVYIHSPLKYSHKLQSASELVHALASELVFGFNAIVEDIYENPQYAEKYRKTILPAACANSLRGQGLIQLQRYQLYKSVGAKLWQQQNIIFKLAQEYRFFEHKLKKGSSELGSIDKQLMINLTLSLCNPYQMKHGQVSETYSLLQKLAEYISLTPEITEQTLFAYTPDSEIPPQATNAIESKQLRWFGIDLTPVVDMLEKSLITEKAGILSIFKKTIELNIDDELKTHILTHLNTVKTRNFIRINSDDSTQVTIGMAASHHFLVAKNGQALYERFYGQKKSKLTSSFQESDLQLQQEESQHGFVWKTGMGDKGGLGFGADNSNKKEDAFASIYKPRSFDEKKTEKEDHPFKEFTTKARYEWVESIIKDVSPAGFCVAFDKAPSQYAETNELITIKNYKKGQEEYNLGLIRWSRWKNNQVFLVGVELISAEATPVRATLDWDYARPAYHHNGLLLPEMHSAGIDASIMLPPLGYRSGQTVAIMTPDDEFKVELMKKVIETDNFIQFHYQIK